MVRKGRPGLPGLLEPDLRTVSAAGDLPVSFLFYWRADDEHGIRTEPAIRTQSTLVEVTPPFTQVLEQNYTNA